jgi:hypothetical protein
LWRDVDREGSEAVETLLDEGSFSGDWVAEDEDFWTRSLYLASSFSGSRERGADERL